MQSSDPVDKTNETRDSAGETQKWTFDYVIVGAGPSAMGLLMGLLLDFQKNKTWTSRDGTTSVGRDNDKNHGVKTVAVLERGNGGVGNDRIIDQLHRWYGASHRHDHVSGKDGSAAVRITPGYLKHNYDSSLEMSPSSRAQSSSAFYRMIDVPVGQGVGGTSRINAGLCIPPSHDDFDTWPSPWNNQHFRNRTRKNEKNAKVFSTSSSSSGTTISATKIDVKDQDPSASARQDCPILSSVHLIQDMMLTNHCLKHSSPLLAKKPTEEGTRNSSDSVWRETVFPSLHLSIPLTAAATHTTRTSDDGRSIKRHDSRKTKRKPALNNEFERRTYYDGLVAPLLLQHEQQQEQDDRNEFIQWFHGVEVQRILFSPSTSSSSSGHNNHSPTSRLRAVGVECSRASGGKTPTSTTFFEIRARREVILCAGAIESPALLLVSGVGHAPGVPSIVPPPAASQGEGDKKDTPTSSLPVGHGLRDHVLLTRTVVATKRTQSTSQQLSANGIQALYQMEIPQPQQQQQQQQQPEPSKNSKVTKTDSLSNLPHGNAKGNSSSSNKTKTWRFQLARMDGAVYYDIVPHVMAGLVRWQWSSSFHNHGNDDNNQQHVQQQQQPLLLRIQLCWNNLLVPLLSMAIEFFLRCLIFFPPVDWFLKNFVITYGLFFLNPTSTGKVSIVPRKKAGKGENSTSILRRCDVDLQIQLPYLTNATDMAAVRTGWIVTQELVSSIFHGIVDTQGEVEVYPGPLIRDNPFGWPTGQQQHRLLDRNKFQAFAKGTCNPYFHFSGTCAIQQQQQQQDEEENGTVTTCARDDWVVDAHLRVRGIDSLRVCDASVFPNCISAPTALTCAALGHCFAVHVLLAEEEEDNTASATDSTSR